MPDIKTHAEPFSLEYGLEHGGKRHYDGAVRCPTVQDRESALEEVPENAGDARINRHVWARTIVRLGDIPKDQITPELLAELIDSDYGPILDAEVAARKKLRPVRVTPEE